MKKDNLKLYTDRILRRVKENENGCLIWQGGQDSRGYGMIAVNRVAKYTHRVIFEGLVDELETGEIVRHICDTPLCCNSKHLVRGSKGDNIRDAFERGQLKRKLPESAVSELRSGVLSIQDAVTRYKVTEWYAYNVKLGHRRTV